MYDCCKKKIIRGDTLIKLLIYKRILEFKIIIIKIKILKCYSPPILTLETLFMNNYFIQT